MSYFESITRGVSPRATSVAAMLARGRATLDRALGSKDGNQPPAVAKAALAWRSASRELDALPDLVTSFVETLHGIRTNKDLTPEAKAQRVQAALDATAGLARDLAATVGQQLDRVESYLEPGSAPARPEPSPTAEAQIAAAKGDITMVCAPLAGQPSVLVKRLADLLARALGDGDSVTAWVLGGSRWPEDFVTSRCPQSDPEHIAAALDEYLGRTLDDAAGTDFAAVRKAYRAVTSVDGAIRLRLAVGQAEQLLHDVVSGYSIGAL